jgi:hypothetical protein
LHSLGEAYLYARVATCAVCGGPLDTADARFDRVAEARTLTLEAVCRRCEAPLDREFDASGVAEAEFALLENARLAGPWEMDPPVLNATDDASQVIDVAGWLTMFTWMNDEARTAGEQARDVAGRSAARRMRLVAGACLEEAGKFFEDDNDLPPDEAFFSDEARRQFWERPELFTRQHIANLRVALVKGA